MHGKLCNIKRRISYIWNLIADICNTVTKIALHFSLLAMKIGILGHFQHGCIICIEKVKSMKKKFAVLIMLYVCIAFVLAGCEYKGYEGENKDLYSVAVDSLLGSRGYNMINGEAFIDPIITILEEDEYGRILFYYFEDSQISTHSLLICQSSDDEYAYYYPDQNYISAPTEEFSNDDIADLKEKNDWNKEINKAKCVKVKLMQKKIQPRISKDMKKKFDILCQKVATENGCKGEEPTVFRYADYCTSDNYGRKLYYVWGVHRDVKGEGISPNSQTMYFDLVMVFNPDDTYDETICVMKLEDKYNYQEDLKAFKDLNNWNKPI